MQSIWEKSSTVVIEMTCNKNRISNITDEAKVNEAYRLDENSETNYIQTAQKDIKNKFE